MRNVFWIIVALSAMLLCPAYGSAEEVFKRMSTAQIEKVLRSMDIEFDKQKDSAGDPTYKIKVRDMKVQIFLFDCEDEVCGSMQLHAGFRLDRKAPCSFVNEWNRKKRYGRIYLDSEGDVHLEYDVDFEGGASPGVIKVAIEKFRVMLVLLAASMS